MMRIAKLYDKISSTYEQFDFYDIFSRTNQAALANIVEAEIFDPINTTQTNTADTQRPPQAIDLGIGDGRFLELFHQKYPNIVLTGLDISAKMLSLAQQKTNFHAINASIEQANLYTPTNFFDLATANFVCAYVGLEKVLSQAKVLLKPNGYLNVTTSTLESFLATQQQIKHLAQSAHPLKHHVGMRLERALKSILVPANNDAIIKAAQHYGFTLVNSKHVVTPVHFRNERDFLEQAINSGFFITLIEQSRLPSKMIHWLAKILVRTFKFPFDDECVVEIVLLQHTGN